MKYWLLFFLIIRMTEEILENLIELGLLSEWSSITDDSFTFKIDGMDNIEYEVNYFFRKTKDYPGANEKINIVQLLAIDKNNNQPFLKFTLGEVGDPEDIAAWIISTILTRRHFSKQLLSVSKLTRKKLINNHVGKPGNLTPIWGEFFDKYENR